MIIQKTPLEYFLELIGGGSFGFLRGIEELFEVDITKNGPNEHETVHKIFALLTADHKPIETTKRKIRSNSASSLPEMITDQPENTEVFLKGLRKEVMLELAELWSSCFRENLFLENPTDVN